MGIVILTIAAVLLLILLTPIGLSGRALLRAGLVFDAGVDWAWGLLSFRFGSNGAVLRFGPFATEIKGFGSKEAERERPQQQGSGPSLKHAGKLLDKKLLAALKPFVVSAVQSLNLKFSVDGEYGSSDPAETGMLAALIAAVPVESGRVNIRPNFCEEVIDLEVAVQARFVPAVLIWVVLSCALAGSVRQLWWPLAFKK